MTDQPEREIGGVAGGGKPIKQKEGVFVSYARSDGRDFAGKLRVKLESDGFKVWQDIAGMQGGRDWWLQIEDAISNVEFLVLVMTPAAMQSKTVRREWQYARQQGVCVYPVRAFGNDDDALFDLIPRWMRDSHFYDLGRDPDHFEDGSQWIRFLNDLRTTCDIPRVPFMAEDLGLYVPRMAEFDALIDLLLDTEREEPKAITSALALKGAGGFGKTTLARAICHDERVQIAFDDGVLWVTLGENPGSLIDKVDGLIYVLSGARSNAPNLEAARTKFAELLANRDILLVIDDVWDFAHLAPFLQGGDRCARLITTRNGDTLPPGARKVGVNEMKLHEAAAVLRFGLTTELRHDSAFRSLAERLGEYPVSLKLANGTLIDRVNSGDTLDNALSYLDRALSKRGLTTALKADNSTDRSRSVEATLTISLERLSAVERARFAQLAIFPDDVDIPLATLEKLWSVDDLDTEDLCRKLDQRSLVLRYSLETRTIRLHDVIRSYLREVLIGGADKLREANAAFLAAYKLDRWADLPDDEPYLWDHLMEHLRAAGRGRELVKTVLDLSFIARQTFLRGTSKTEISILFARLVMTLPIQASTQHTINDDGFNYENLAHGTPQALADNYRNMAHLLNRCTNIREIEAMLYTRLKHIRMLDASIERLLAALAPPYFTIWRNLPDLPDSELVRVFEGHALGVNSVSFNLDRRWIVSTSDDKKVRLWDFRSGEIVRVFTGHTAMVHGASFNLDNQLIVSASYDQTVRVWNTSSGEMVRVLEGHTNSVRTAVFSADGRQIVSASWDRTVRVWNAATGDTVHVLTGHEHYVSSAAFSPNGRMIVSASHDNTVRLWDTASGQLIRVLQGHEGTVNSAAFSPDGRWIVSASSDQTLRVWDAASGDSRVLEGHRWWVMDAEFSSDATWIVSGSRDNTLRQWNTQTGETIRILNGHTGAVSSIAVSPEGQYIVSASDDRTIRLWYVGIPWITSPEKAQTAKVVSNHTNDITSLAFSPNGRWMVSTSEDSMRLWNLETDETPVLQWRNNWAFTVAFSPDSTWVVTANSDKTVRQYNVETGYIRTLKGHTNEVSSAAYSPDGRSIVSSSNDNTVRVWNVVNSESRVFEGHTLRVNSAAFSPDGQWIVSASSDYRVRVWKVPPHPTFPLEPSRVLQGHENGVRSAVFSPDGRWIVSASRDQTLRLWDVATQETIHVLKGHTRSINEAVFSPDGKHILSASSDGSLRLWDAATGEKITAFQADAALFCCAFHPDGLRVAAGGANGKLYWLRLVL